MTPAADRQGLAASRIDRAQANLLKARDAVADRKDQGTVGLRGVTAANS